MNATVFMLYGSFGPHNPERSLQSTTARKQPGRGLVNANTVQLALLCGGLFLLNGPLRQAVRALKTNFLARRQCEFFGQERSCSSRESLSLECPFVQRTLQQGVHVEQGSDSSSGVRYAYRLTQKASWFGSHECCVHKRLLVANCPAQLSTKFTFGGHNWELAFVHSRDGHLEGHLYIKSPVCAEVHLSMTVINNKFPEKSITHAALVKVSPIGHKTFQLVPVGQLVSNGSGFIRKNSFVIRTNLRIKKAENESGCLSVNGKCGLYIWQIKNPFDMSPTELASEQITIGGRRWTVNLYPSGKDQNVNHVSVFVRSCSTSTVQAKVGMIAVNCKSLKENRVEEFTHTFRDQGWYGLSQFLEQDALKNGEMGFLNDGWLTLIVRIAAEDARRGQMLDRAESSQSEEPECVVCLDRAQTSGFLHGNTSHKCVCKACAKKLFEREPNLKCPVCRLPVDHVIFDYF